MSNTTVVVSTSSDPSYAASSDTYQLTVYSVPLTFEIEILDPKATAAANAGQGGGA